MRVADFDFDLPESAIALEPVRPRDSARLLHVTGEGFSDQIVRALPTLLRPNDLLVLNDTRVIPAQLQGIRPARSTGGGGPVEVDVTLLKRLAPERPDGARWSAFLRPARRLRVGDRVEFTKGFEAEVVAREEAEGVLQFNLAGAAFDAGLACVGKPPLPPYIARRRGWRDADVADYQTVYAKSAGSVAAPTAGLHFTDELFAALDARGVGRLLITLHVGAGTFLPVAVEDARDHKMHAEWGEVTPAQAARVNAARAQGGRIVAVGTTSLRLLESAARADGVVESFCAETSIFITPGYQFRAVDMLMTNFHLPRSTLFMLVAAFSGLDRMRQAYAHAVASGFRFYSYGDACLLERVA